MTLATQRTATLGLLRLPISDDKRESAHSRYVLKMFWLSLVARSSQDRSTYDGDVGRNCNAVHHRFGASYSLCC